MQKINKHIVQFTLFITLQMYDRFCLFLSFTSLYIQAQAIVKQVNYFYLFQLTHKMEKW